MEFIKSAIAQMIFDKFGEGYKIYTEMIEQGFVRPCFFIFLEYGKIKRLLNGNRLFCFKCNILFYPKKEKINKDMLEATIKLFEGCENISTDKWRLKYLEGNYSVEKDRLVFSAEFKIKIDKEEESELMRRLFLEGGYVNEAKRVGN